MTDKMDMALLRYLRSLSPGDALRNGYDPTRCFRAGYLAALEDAASQCEKQDLPGVAFNVRALGAEEREET